MESDWRQYLTAAIRKAKITVVGQDDIKNEAQAKVAIAVIRLYGDSAAGFIYFEPCTARSTYHPPDVLICHPSLGLLVIEVKGFFLNSIQKVEAGSLFVRQEGYNRPINAFRQAEDAMFEIEDEIKRIVRKRRDLPLCNCMVALPNISEAEMSVKGWDKAMPNDKVLYKEQIESTTRLEKRVSRLIQESLAEAHKDTPITADQVKVTKKVFGDSAVINEKRPVRSGVPERSLGAMLDELAVLEKHLSEEQIELSRLNVDGYPRLIRGVAGSGKTVILANMVARLINRKVAHPDDMFQGPAPLPRVAVLCFNRALVQFIKRKIKDSFYQQTQSALPDCATVTHFNGLMEELSNQGIWNYIAIKELEDQAARSMKYSQQLEQFKNDNPDWYKSILYDAIFIDEGQDLNVEDYQLLLGLVRPDPTTGEKTIIIFYDDAQNLYGRPRPNWKQIGIDVGRGDRARVMKECFRNTKEIIELAFNVLLGSQAPQEIKVKTRTFADLNYLKQWGLVEEYGDRFMVKFAERTFKKPAILKFDTRDAEKEWVAQEVMRLVIHENVRPEDILILFNSGKAFDDLTEQIKANSIKGFIKPYGESPEKDQYIFRDDYLTLSTTRGAKGYDAHVVFLIGTDQFIPDTTGRASFYVGATRAKTLLYISGLDKPGTLLTEAAELNS